MRSIRKIIDNSVSVYLRNNNIKRNSSIIAAFSGGPDSTVLLSVLSGLKNYPLNITAAYYNHRLRPEKELTAELEVVRSTAEKFGINIEIGYALEGQIINEASRQRLSIEESARNARYSFLYETMKKNGADYIATGHNLNDNSETMLMRFLQNSGTDGLSGIPEKSGVIIRPLCGVSRNDIEQMVNEEKIVCSLDRTNLRNDYLRNKMRLDVIPAVKKVFPEFDKNMSGLSSKIKKYNDFIESETEKRICWEVSANGWKTDAEKFFAEHELLRQKSMYRVLNRVSSCRRIRYSAVEQAVSKSRHENGKCLLRLSDAEVFTGNGFIFVHRLVNRGKKSYLLMMTAGESAQICGQFFILADDLSLSDKRQSGCQTIELFSDYPLIIRSFREGDAIETCSGAKSLKKLFNEWKINSEDKYRIPVIENSSRILAVVGKQLGYENKIAPQKHNADVGLKKILLIINSDTETTGE